MPERVLIPVIDLFAGPGGLGEGFARFRPPGNSRFKVRLSIEKDYYAHQTLLLRAFCRQFPAGRVPALYYDILRGTADRDALFARFPEQATAAATETWHAELGAVEHLEVNHRIEAALGRAQEWVPIGGPLAEGLGVCHLVRCLLLGLAAPAPAGPLRCGAGRAKGVASADRAVARRGRRGLTRACSRRRSVRA